METWIFREMFDVIKAEQRLRNSQVTDEESLDRWKFTDEPFLNELCLMLLVSLRHQVERELVRFSGRADHDGKEISGNQYAKKVKEERERLRKSNEWEKVAVKLKMKSCGRYEPMKALRHLANSYKHDPWKEPEKKLLKLLHVETGDIYAPLPENLAVQEGLAVLVGLGKSSPYWEIADQFVDAASKFLSDLQRRAKLSSVKSEPIRLVPAR